VIDELGFAWLPQDDFVEEHFAADGDPTEAKVMWLSSNPRRLRPWGM
jgi:hypothetical protein